MIIFKHQLSTEPDSIGKIQEFTLQSSSVIVAFGSQQGNLVFWESHYEDINEPKIYRLIVAFTGKVINKPEDCRFLEYRGHVQIGYFVFHLLELTDFKSN